MTEHTFRAISPLTTLRLSALVLSLGLTACANMSGVAPPQSTLRDAASLGLQGSGVSNGPAKGPQNGLAVSAQWWRDPSVQKWF